MVLWYSTIFEMRFQDCGYQRTLMKACVKSYSSAIFTHFIGKDAGEGQYHKIRYLPVESSREEREGAILLSLFESVSNHSPELYHNCVYDIFHMFLSVDLVTAIVVR